MSSDRRILVVDDMDGLRASLAANLYLKRRAQGEVDAGPHRTVQAAVGAAVEVVEGLVASFLREGRFHA